MDKERSIEFSKDLFRQSTYFSENNPRYQNSDSNVIDIGFQEDVKLVNDKNFEFVIPLKFCYESLNKIDVEIPYKIDDNLKTRILKSDKEPVTDPVFFIYIYIC